MARLRTFLAVDLGQSIRDQAVALQKDLARAAGTEVKWVEPENLHATLLFLGEVDERQVPRVCQIVAQETARHPAFEMSIETAGCFPNARRPRILWVGVGQGSQELCALHDSLEQGLEALGFRREERRYTPHITLGRVKSERPADQLAAVLAQHAGWKGGETTVRELLVMSSRLTPRGPIYSVLSRAKLG